MSLELNKYVRFMFFLYVIRPKKAWVKPLPINLEKHEVARCTSLMCSLDAPKCGESGRSIGFIYIRSESKAIT